MKLSSILFNYFVSRMFAGDHAEVDDSDIVVTVDINLFVMNRNVLR